MVVSDHSDVDKYIEQVMSEKIEKVEAIIRPLNSTKSIKIALGIARR